MYEMSFRQRIGNILSDAKLSVDLVVHEISTVPNMSETAREIKEIKTRIDAIIEKIKEEDND